MTSNNYKSFLFFIIFFFTTTVLGLAQENFKLKFKNSLIYSGIEVGSKGVKMSILEMGKNAQKDGTFNLLQDTALNTDFITFSEPTFTATLNALITLYEIASIEYRIPTQRIFTAVSSGVKIQAEKDDKISWVKNLIDSFKLKVQEPSRLVEIIDVRQEARLSHLGIVPEARRYSTFLIDIGSGNTKGGYFPNGNTKDLKLFQLTWGTKSISNETVKRLEEDNTINNYFKQMGRVLSGAANTEIVYAVNLSGAYNMSDNIAFSGGIAWAVSTLLYPELLDNPVVPVTYQEVEKLGEILFKNYAMVSDSAITRSITLKNLDKKAIASEVKRVNKVFDQRSMLAGTGLLLRIMRQFEGVYEKKQFFLVKNGAVGWISAYVDQSINK